MTSLERLEDGKATGDQDPGDKSGGYGLEWIEEFIDMGIEAMSEIHQAYQDSQSLIENNRLLDHLGLTDLENPIQKQAAEMFKFFLTEDFLKNRLKAVKADIDSESQEEVVTDALKFVAQVNKEELDLIPDKAEPIREAVRELADDVESETGAPLNPGTPINPALLAKWAEKHRLINT
jgi:hypothetical protein